MVDRETIQMLIRVGELGDIRHPEVQAFKNGLDQTSYIGGNAPIGRKIAADLSDADLASLIRGLVLVEGSFTGGSCALANFIWGPLEGRNVALAREVANWVLLRTRNPYVPFNTRHSHQMKSYNDFAAWRERRGRHYRDVEERRAVEAKALALRRQAAAQVNRERVSAQQRNAALRRNEVDAMLAKGSLEMLRQMSVDVKHPVQWYPVIDLAGLTTAELHSLGPQCRVALVERLKGIRKGPWRELCDQLRLHDAHNAHVANGLE